MLALSDALCIGAAALNVSCDARPLKFKRAKVHRDACIHRAERPPLLIAVDIRLSLSDTKRLGSLWVYLMKVHECCKAAQSRGRPCTNTSMFTEMDTHNIIAH